MTSISLKRDTHTNRTMVASGSFDTTHFATLEHNYSVAFLDQSHVNSTTKKSYEYLHFLYSGERAVFHKYLENSKADTTNPKLNIKISTRTDAHTDAKNLETIINDVSNECFMDWDEMILYYVQTGGSDTLKIFRLNDPSNMSDIPRF